MSGIISSDQTITFNTEIFVGSNVTNSSGVITIGDAGVYLCHSRLCNYNVGVQDIDCNFKINSTEKPATRSYQDFLSGTDGFSYALFWSIKVHIISKLSEACSATILSF